MLTKIFLAVIIPFISLTNLSNQNNYTLNEKNKNTINVLIGEEAFKNEFNKEPDNSTDENIRITTHLKYVENKLRNRINLNLNSEQINKRNHNLDLLKEYISIEKFPKNYDYPNERKPTFLDKDGNICAVGYLVLKTSGKDLVNEINNKYKYSYIYQMNNNKLMEWITKSGLTLDELQLIQPTYGNESERTLVPFIFIGFSILFVTSIIVGTTYILYNKAVNNDKVKPQENEGNKFLSLDIFNSNNFLLDKTYLNENNLSYSIIKF